MKHRNILALAATAAITLLAIAGAGTASATTLFTDSAKTQAYATGTQIEATLAPGTMAVVTGTDGSHLKTCSGSSMNGTTQNGSGTYVTIALSSVTWSGCTQTTHTVTLGSLHIDFTSGSNGTVIATTLAVTTQTFGVSCTYTAGAGTHLGTLTGGTTPHITIEATVPKKAGGFLCPATVGWDRTYVITSPHAIFVGA